MKRAKSLVAAVPRCVLDSGGVTALVGRSQAARAWLRWVVTQGGDIVIPTPVLRGVHDRTCFARRGDQPRPRSSGQVWNCVEGSARTDSSSCGRAPVCCTLGRRHRRAGCCGSSVGVQTKCAADVRSERSGKVAGEHASGQRSPRLNTLLNAKCAPTAREPQPAAVLGRARRLRARLRA
jgi:hypothetical protein